MQQFHDSCLNLATFGEKSSEGVGDDLAAEVKAAENLHVALTGDILRCLDALHHEFRLDASL
jgi:hypothetical protein